MDDSIHVEIKYIKEKVDDLAGKIDKLAECSEKKYAAIWTQYAMTGLISTIIVAVIGALLGLVLVPPARSAMTFIIRLFA